MLCTLHEVHSVYMSLSLILSLQDLINQFSMFLPLCDPFAPSVLLDFPLDFSLVLFTLSFTLTLGPSLALLALAR